MHICAKIISSLEKVFLEDTPDCFDELTYLSLLKGERVSFQLICRIAPDEPSRRALLTPTVSGTLAPYTVLREVKNVPVECPVEQGSSKDDQYLRRTPGLYPDILNPIEDSHHRITVSKQSASVWIDVALPEDVAFSGKHALTFTLTAPDGTVASENTICLDIIPAVLPRQSFYLTQWFHTDSIANYYEVEPWSETHWEYVENFARVARKNGQNMILTPVFTPELDTEVGGERLTTQLVQVRCTNGVYELDFSLLDRWIDMCDRVGIEYLEISHLFSQWGAAATPKVMATVNGEYRQIFGWDTPSTSDTYRTFLRQFLSEFLSHMKARGDDKRCFFHISDEPGPGQAMENYRAAKGMVEDILEGYPIMDALSSFEFWEKGIVDTPIPHAAAIEPFLENHVPHLWTYYCGAAERISGRAMAMPSWRNRCLGLQLYKYHIVGFLHWGYNFYNSCWSTKSINPFLDASGDRWVTAGDPYVVYPGPHGMCLESLRLVVFGQAIQDISALRLCESYYSHEEVVAEMEKIFGGTMTFSTCVQDGKTMLAIRERINDMIRAKL